jgi:UDP-N-acetylmuramyl-tripeptide synthetase
MSAAQQLAFDVPALLARLGIVPRRVTADSRDVRRGDAFAAFPGSQSDGRRFIGDAVGRGAGAVFWEAAGFAWDSAWAVPEQPVVQLRDRLGAIADQVYGRPSQAMWVVGITGTNGKTSCAHWIAQGLDACGRRTGVLGTLGNGLAGALAPALNTTTDAARLHETLATLKAAGADAVAMEVSSHGLDQGRVNAVAFDVALFTNLSRDHLDYHVTMEAYGAAKAKLLRWPGLAVAVINVDDAFGRTLAAARHAERARTLTFGTHGADIVATRITATSQGMAIDVTTPFGAGSVEAPVVGTFNVSNLLGSLGVLLASDVPLADALAALGQIQPPPGRMQRFGGGDAPLVVVDYAHSPDALDKALSALRSTVAAGRSLVCVFGCGGDRDPGKRPEMGRIAARLADRIVVTNDNPRSEDPAAIAEAIGVGIREADGTDYDVELDRGVAIRSAIRAARAGDVVLVAGKGHETYQEAAGVRVHFSDAEAVVAAILERQDA